MGFADEILVRLGLDQTTLGRGLAQSKAQITEFGKSTKEGFNDIMKELAAPLTGVGIIAGVERVFGKVDEIERTAAATGLAAEEFQRLSYASRQVGIDSDTMEKSLDFLAKTLGEAGGAGPEAKEAAEKFSEFGIAIRGSDGHLRSTSDLLDEISNKMAAMTDPAQKAEMAVELLGKSGSKLVSILGEGAGSLHARGKGASIFSEEDIENIKQAHNEIEGITNTLTVWLGKGISAIGSGAAALGKSVSHGLQAAQDDERTVATLKRIAEMKKATKDRMDYEAEKQKEMEDQLHRIAERHRADRAEEDHKAALAVNKELRDEYKKERDEAHRIKKEHIQQEYLLRKQAETELAITARKNQDYYSNVGDLAKGPGGWAYDIARQIENRERWQKRFAYMHGTNSRDWQIGGFGSPAESFSKYRDFTEVLKKELEDSGYISPEISMQKMNDSLTGILSKMNESGGLPVSVNIQ